MEITKETRIGAIAAYDYRTSAVFEQHQINFCSAGGQTILEVCINKGLSPGKLINDLKTAIASRERIHANFNYWPIDLLADYIEKKHHRYAAEKVPHILNGLYMIADLCGHSYPRLKDMHAMFGEAGRELQQHMKKEEEMLFPYIRKIALSRQENRRLEDRPCLSLEKPVNEFLKEHELEMNAFSQISGMAGEIQPLSADNVLFGTLLMQLKEFEADLCLHTHLENNILFPKALEMENVVER